MTQKVIEKEVNINTHKTYIWIYHDRRSHYILDVRKPIPIKIRINGGKYATS